MAIDAEHPQYTKHKDKWKLIDDVLCEENLVDYLIELNPKDKSQLNKDRNKAYKERAVFYALAGYTASGMLGTVYSKLPEVDVPSAIDYVKYNVDGRGNSITQQSKVVVSDVVSKSRSGLFVTFPATKGAISKADVVSGKFVPSIHYIHAKRIVNWAEAQIGSKIFLSLVVFKDTKSSLEDYEHKDVDVYRELYIDPDDGIYKERHWIENDKGQWEVDGNGIQIPKGANGQPMSEIPFTFVGAENNDPDVDKPMMHGMCSVNISHYRNSADLEDSSWFAGQPQPWMSGLDLTQENIDLMEKNNIYFGSRNVIMAPEGGTFGVASSPANPLVRQLMVDKVEMMIGIGARMITPGGVAKTAEQSSNERETQHSQLSLATSNVSAAYMKCFGWIGIYTGIDLSEAIFKLNDDFNKIGATPAELKEIIIGFVGGSIPIGDYVAYMKKYGVFDEEKSVEDYSDLISVPSSESI